MRVYHVDNTIINVDDNDPQINSLVKLGAEELPIDIFGGKGNFADNDNTKKVDGQWVFSFDIEAYEAEQTTQLATEERGKRDSLLAACDWTQFADSPLEAEGMTLWQDYRQALRDVPQQDGFPGSINWPDPPA